MEKSFVVLGKNLEDTLEKSEVLLHCPKERIAYEILQNPKSGRNGHPGIPCKLRVVPVALPAEDLAAPMEAAPAAAERLPWAKCDLEIMPSSVFLLSLQNLITLVPRTPLFSPAPVLAADENSETLEIVQDIGLGCCLPLHPGNVIIYGNVRKGSRVQATGNITVHGDVETAFLDAGGDITIRGGLLGTLRTQTGSLKCKFAQGARLTAPSGDITIEESCMHSHLRSGHAAFVGDTLLGGTCYAETLVEIGVAGSESGVPTHLIAGRNTRLMEEVEEIRQRALESVKDLQSEDLVCRELLPSEEAGRILPVEDRLRLWRALMEKTRLNDVLVQLSRHKSLLLGMINQDHNARVCIIDRVYPQVKVTVDELTQEVHHLTQFVTFTKDYDAGELRMTSYR